MLALAVSKKVEGFEIVQRVPMLVLC